MAWGANLAAAPNIAGAKEDRGMKFIVGGKERRVHTKVNKAPN